MFSFDAFEYELTVILMNEDRLKRKQKKDKNKAHDCNSNFINILAYLFVNRSVMRTGSINSSQRSKQIRIQQPGACNVTCSP